MNNARSILYDEISTIYTSYRRGISGSFFLSLSFSCVQVIIKKLSNYNFFVQNVFSRYIIMEDLWMFVLASFVILSFVVVNMMAARLNPPVNAQNNPVNAQNNPVNARNKRPFQFYPRATLGRANRHSES